MRKTLVLSLAAVLLVSLSWAQEVKAPAAPPWQEPMKKLHADFKGTPGYVSQFGDSITYSMAFWSVMSWADPSTYLKDDGLPKKPKDKRWQDVILGSRDKEAENGNYSGWRVGDVLGVIDKVLAAKKPEMAIIMIGTNDISGGKVPADYQPGLEKIVQKCLDAKCIPILNTIPPRKGQMPAVEEANKIVKATAEKFKVPLVDYCAEILARQPGEAWLGTLIDGGDGVHPTGGKNEVYTEENLKVSGYALRNWVNFLMVRQIYFNIVAPEK